MLLSRQFGLIVRDQALEIGFTSRHIEGKLRRREWKALYRGVYADTSFPSRWKQTVLAAVFRGGVSTVASGRCAAALLELPGFEPRGIEVSTPHDVRNVPFIAHLVAIASDEQTFIGPIPCTNAGRTLLDLAGAISRQQLEDALDDVLRRKLISLPRLKWIINELDGRGRDGIGRLREAVRERSDGKPIPESVLETRLWRPLKHLGAPAPMRQYPVRYDGHNYRIDFAFPHAKVAVEAQSLRWHTDLSARKRDMDKANAIQACGWRGPIYVTWDDMYDTTRKTFNLLHQMLLPNLFER